MKEVFKLLEQKLEIICDQESAKGALFGNSYGFCVATNKLPGHLAGSAYALLNKANQFARNEGDHPIVHVEGHSDVYLVKGNDDYFLLAKKSRT